MEALRNSAKKHPILHGIFIIILFELAMIACSVIVALALPPFFTQNGEWLIQAAVEALLCGVGFGLMALYGYNKIWREKGRGVLTGIAVSGYFLVICMLNLVSTFADAFQNQREWEEPWKIAVFVICVFLIGLCEETFFRGILANLFWDKHAKDSHGVWTAAIWTGLIFGLLHLFNMIGADSSDYVVGVIVQTFNAVVMGIALTAIYYRCRNIWVLAALHGFIDLCGAAEQGFFPGGSLSDAIGSYTPIMVVASIPYIIVILVLLRPSKVREIVAYRQSQEGFEYGELELSEQQEKSKKFCIFTVVFAVVLFVLLYGLSVVLYNSTFYVNYAETKVFAAETEFISDTVADFTAEESGSVTIYVQSVPDRESAYVRITVYSDSDVAFDETYGGTCSDSQSIHVEAGKNYRVKVEYDYSQNDTPTDIAHIVSIGIKK